MKTDSFESGPADPRENRLAQANLCRLRGEYDRAEALCVEAIQANPDRVEAMAMLGDICAELGALDKAKHWFSMAADIKPPLPGVLDKLNAVNRRIAAEEQSSNAAAHAKKVLRTQQMVTIAAILFAVVALGAAVVSGSRRAKSTFTAPQVTVGPGKVITGQTSADQTTTQPLNPSATDSNSPALAAIIALGRPESKLALAAFDDPRSRTLFLTAGAPADLSPASVKETAGRLAADGLIASPNADMVTIRIVRRQQTLYIADLSRATYVSAGGIDVGASASQSSASSGVDPSGLLTNEWPADSGSTDLEHPGSKGPGTDGQSQNGTSQNGAGQNGAGQNGASQNGSSMTGTGTYPSSNAGGAGHHSDGDPTYSG